MPGELLTGATRLSRAGVWKHIHYLRHQGFGITASIKKGYCLTEIPDRLFPALIQTGLETKIVAREVYYFESIDSTNRIAKQYAAEAVTDGTVVIAEEQTRGKGRMNRDWVSPQYSNILCSVIFYPPMPTSKVFRLTMLASIAVVRTLAAVCGVAASIKWPNDVYINGKKVCGILTEFFADHDSIKYAVVGIGLNVNIDIAHYPAIAGSATSLLQVCGHRVSRLTVFKNLAKQIDSLYQELLSTDGEDLQKEWQRHSMVCNRQVSIVSGEKIMRGTARGITRDGHLVLIDEQGELHEIVCGDLSLNLSEQ